jgi:PHD/YefM family antitoxin component YafN of YafNO toxin-antitoxin module
MLPSLEGAPAMPTTVTIDEFRRQRHRFVDEAEHGGSTVVNVSVQELAKLVELIEEWEETFSLMSGGNGKHLRQALAEAERGELEEHELIRE